MKPNAVMRRMLVGGLLAVNLGASVLAAVTHMPSMGDRTGPPGADKAMAVAAF